MPNWCSNHIELSGPKDKIEALWLEAKEENKLLELLVPFEGTDYDREFAINCWGTKWDVDTEYLDFEPDGDYSRITGYMESAWSPPTEALHTWMDNNPDCEAQLFFYEPAMDFAGCLDGEITLSECDDDYFKHTELGELLDSHFNILEDRLEE